MNTSTPRVRRVLLAGAALAAAALAAGCTSGSATGSISGAPPTSTSAPATSAPATSAPAATTAPPATGSASGATGSGSPTSQPNAAGGAPACASADLHVSLGLSQGAAGSTYQVIDFINIGTAPCTLYGYPGVSLAGGSPVAQIGAAAARDTTTSHATLVTLPVHGAANALLRVVDALNFPTSACAPVPSTELQVYPPNQKAALFVSYTSTACSNSATKLLTIGAVRSGTGG